ncbi:hypothetical protein [Streptomyces europaeiscabiei]|uniref:hypothetical protein n=1 Tax=Streptomyces europaeiscabiei TaxID=146819 RepID=UPI0029AAFF8C|nr:hypothetical protein [Streptomyces europaeiscabiei]MDX3581954.1 hypothetical protein [Streptomyces europaeiscabiei]
MTASDSLPLHALAEDNLDSASPDPLRARVKTFADALILPVGGASMRNTVISRGISDS